MSSRAKRSRAAATVADTGRRVGEHRCRVVAHVAVNSDYRRLVLAAPAGALAAAAGQFFHLLCPAGPAGTPLLRRPMSVYRIEPEAGRVPFLYKVHGEGTRALATLVAGDVFEILGPLGRGFRLEPHWRHALLVGRGVGLASLAPLAEACRTRGLALTAILSARRADLVISEDLIRQAGARVHAVDAAATARLTAALRRAVAGPLWVKLSPNASDIAAIARVAAAEGADAVVVANTILGMAVDVGTRRAELGADMGGLSGPAVKPVVLRMAYQCARAVDIPVIGCGGIATVEDVLEFTIAGCAAVQVGTATFRHPTTMIQLGDGLEAWCRAHDVTRLADLVGTLEPFAVPGVVARDGLAAE